MIASLSIKLIGGGMTSLINQVCLECYLEWTTLMSIPKRPKDNSSVGNAIITVVLVQLAFPEELIDNLSAGNSQINYHYTCSVGICLWIVIVSIHQEISFGPLVFYPFKDVVFVWRVLGDSRYNVCLTAQIFNLESGWDWTTI